MYYMLLYTIKADYMSLITYDARYCSLYRAVNKKS